MLLALLAAYMFPAARTAWVVFWASSTRLGAILMTRWGLVLQVICFGALITTSGANQAGGDVGLVPPPEVRRYLDVSAVWLFYLWINYGLLKIAGLPILFKGLEAGVNKKRIAAIQILNAINGAVLMSFATSALPPPFAVVAGLIAAYVAGVWRNLSMMRIAAILRRQYAPVARDECRDSVVDSPFLMHLSDLHVTGNQNRRVDGGVSGNQNLLEVVDRTTDRTLPRFCLVTGDLIDWGLDSEWKFAIPHLTALRNRGCRILLAPGNHDLATAYVYWRSLVFLSTSPPGQAPADASLLISYLRAASTLEPELRSHGGEAISSIVEREVTPVEDLHEAWRTAVSRAYALVRDNSRYPQIIRSARPEHYEARILGLLEAVDEAAAAQLINPLVDRAMAAFPPPMFVDGEVGRRKWGTFFKNTRDCHLHPALVAAKWQPLWRDIFPLRLRAPEQGVEFFIVNSTDPTSGLLASAFGHLSQPQLERLYSGIGECAGRTVVILMHHAICGWTGCAEDMRGNRRVDISKWALLAHNTEESIDIVCSLSNLIKNKGVKQIVICSGHRHTQSRAGPFLDRNEGNPVASGRVVAMESAAGCDFRLPGDDGSHHLLFANLDSEGFLRPFRARLDRLDCVDQLANRR